MTVIDDSRLDANQPPPPTNLYSTDELKRIQDALTAYQAIKKETTRHRDDYLKVIGPALVLIRDRVFEVSGVHHVSAQAYRDAMGEELKRTGLDVIDKSTRSYLLRIMDNLPAVEAYLADRPNPERLNHPKTIWTALYRHDMYQQKWEDDGDDPEDYEEYLKEWQPEDEEQERADQQQQQEEEDYELTEEKHKEVLSDIERRHKEEEDRKQAQRKAREHCQHCGKKSKIIYPIIVKNGTDGSGEEEDNFNVCSECWHKWADGHEDAADRRQQEKDTANQQQKEEENVWSPENYCLTYCPTYFNHMDWELKFFMVDLRATTDLSAIGADDRTKIIERLESINTKTRACLDTLETNDKKHLEGNNN